MVILCAKWNGILIEFTKFPKIHILLHTLSYCYSYATLVAFSG